MSYPMDWSLPRSSVPGISQARIPERAAIAYSRGWDTTEQRNSNHDSSRGSSLGWNRRLPHWHADSSPLHHLASPDRGHSTVQTSTKRMKWAVAPECHLVLTAFRYMYRLHIQSIFGFPKLPQKCLFTYGSVQLKSIQGPQIILGCCILISNISSNLQ